MRVLYLTCHLPYPPVSGGRLRDFELVTRLAHAFEMHVCAVSKTVEEDSRAIREFASRCASVTLFPAAGETADDGSPYQVRRHRSPAASRFVRRLVHEERVDLVHVEGFYLHQHVPFTGAPPTLLVDQNVEYALWRQRVDTARDRDERRARFLEYRRTREAELAAWRSSTLCAAVTEDDRALMLRADRRLDVRLVPDGADHLGTGTPGAAAAGTERPTVVFVGNFGYEPNVDAALYLCRSIAPAVRVCCPELEVVLVGNEPPPAIRALADALTVVTGRVPDVRPYLDRATVVVCPLRIGGGIKVKVLEALRRGKAIVSTSVGAQGLGAARTAVRIEDEPEDFAAALVDLLVRPDKRRCLEQEALRLARGLPTWDDSAAALAASYAELAATKLEPVASQELAEGLSGS